MTALDTAVRSILFHPRLMKNRAYNGKRYQFNNGRLKETAKFALLRRFGWTVTDRSEGGAVIITIAPPEIEWQRKYRKDISGYFCGCYCFLFFLIAAKSLFF